VRRITERGREGYAPLYASFESFYTRNVYRRLKNVFNRPIKSAPGGTVNLVGRTSDDHYWTWRIQKDDSADRQECVNLASYNYLGFAESSGKCSDETIAEVDRSGLTTSSSRHELGTRLLLADRVMMLIIGRCAIHNELEETVAEFLGVEAVMTVGMGFATNSMNLPMLIGGPNTLVLSDEKVWKPS